MPYDVRKDLERISENAEQILAGRRNFSIPARRMFFDRDLTRPCFYRCF